jgi:hypothetical protein
VADISGFPYLEVEFDKNGDAVDAAAVDRAADFAKSGAATDLFVVSHGWNNDIAEARDLYRELFACVRRVLDATPALTARRFAVVGLFWPSKKFTDEELIPGGAAAVDDGSVALAARLRGLKGAFDNPKGDALLEEAAALAPRLDDSAPARARFVEIMRSLPARGRDTREDASDRFFEDDPEDLYARLDRPAELIAPDGGEGGALGLGAVEGGAENGGAAGIGDFFSGLKQGAENLLNFTTYYQMKERAGKVGGTGARALVARIRAEAPDVKVHLVGHSFGGRLVTAVANALDGDVHTMTLLQAAFSHNGFGENFDKKHHDGFFRGVVVRNRVRGPLLVTHTRNDRAVGLAYPIASRIAFDNANALGDAGDQFGGIGRNGALFCATRDTTLGAVGTAYGFAPGTIYNLDADAVITGHSDIRKDEVAHAILSAVAAT